MVPMEKRILDHYLQFGEYTNPGLYKEILQKNLPENVREIGLLVRKQLVHRSTLKNGNTGSNKDLRYGDMTKVPWYRQAEDDVFPTASAMLAELFRRDPRGFISDRVVEDKLILTCRFTAILMASILKAKGVPTRVRSGFASYFMVEGLEEGTSDDHWINEYWDESKSHWVTIDADGCLEGYLNFDPFDLPSGTFDFSADAWIAVRRGEVEGSHFKDAAGFEGLITIGWELFHDFHSLMNNEIIYQQGPSFGWGRMDKLTESELEEIDKLAKLMQNPDVNFDKLREIWETNNKFRILKGGLL
jgi:hypothetical protein